jgi:hemerythrin superfamily protein
MARAPLDAIDILEADHRELGELFERVRRRTCIGKGKEALVGEICLALKRHFTIEEEVAYPAFRAADVGIEVIDEAEIEHEAIKQLIARLQSMGAADPHYDARVTVLWAYWKHHVTEEESAMFPRARSSDADLEALGKDLIEFKRQLAVGGLPHAAESMLGIGAGV